MNFLSNRIKAARLQQGLSQAELADATGVTQPAVANWERGSHIPRAAVIERIGEALSVESDWLLTGGSQRSYQVSAEYLSTPIQHVPVFPLSTYGMPVPAEPVGFFPYAARHKNLFALSSKAGANTPAILYICSPDRAIGTGSFVRVKNHRVEFVTEADSYNRILGRVLAEVTFYAPPR